MRREVSEQTKHSPSAQARAHRIAAEAARRNPYFTPEQGEERAKHYEREAERLEGLAR